MKLEELYQHIQEDFPIKKIDLAEESFKSSKLFVKYIKLWSDESLILRKLHLNKKALEYEKRDYYSGNAPAEVYRLKPFNLKVRQGPQLERYIMSDADIIKLDEQIAVQDQKVDVLVNCLDEIKRRGYAIKTALDDIKFKAGE